MIKAVSQIGLSASSSGYVSIGYLCSRYGMSPPTVRTIVDTEPSIDSIKTLGSHRRISERSFRVFLGLENEKVSKVTGTKCLIVTRVSSLPQQDSLKQQEADCRLWLEKNVPDAVIEVNSRICSGLLLDHSSFIAIIDGVLTKKWDLLICRTSERLCRSALCLVRKLCDRSGIQLVVVDDANKSWAELLTDDILALCGSAHAKVNGEKARKLLQINISEENLQCLYKLYQQGYSYKQLAEYCETTDIKGLRGEVLAGATIARVLKRHLKILKALDLENEKSSIERFYEDRIGFDPAGRLSMVNLLQSYRTYCKQNSVAPLHQMAVVTFLKTKGFYSAPIVSYANGGVRQFRGVALKVK